MNKFPHIKQPDSMECGATCLRMIAKFHGKEYSAETMQSFALSLEKEFPCWVWLMPPSI